MSETLKSLVDYSKINNRVCPMPQKWNDLYNMLPNRRQVGAGWEPPQPLILGAWHYTSDFEKMQRLEQHIEWANKHGKLPEVSSYLRSLTESDWHHLGQ